MLLCYLPPKKLVPFTNTALSALHMANIRSTNSAISSFSHPGLLINRLALPKNTDTRPAAASSHPYPIAIRTARSYRGASERGKNGNPVPGLEGFWKSARAPEAARLFAGTDACFECAGGVSLFYLFFFTSLFVTSVSATRETRTKVRKARAFFLLITVRPSVKVLN